MATLGGRNTPLLRIDATAIKVIGNACSCVVNFARGHYLQKLTSAFLSFIIPGSLIISIGKLLPDIPLRNYILLSKLALPHRS